MDVIKIEQAKSDYQKIVSFIEDGSPLPPETDPYWGACAALDRLGKFIADIEGAKNTEKGKENAIKNILNDKIKIEKEVAIKRLGETESSTVSTFMGVNIKEFTKEELIKILSLQQRKWLESIGFKYEE